jgi:hypothetical protein
MKKTTPGIVLLSLLIAPAALADKAAGKKCASTLEPRARLVFDAVIANPEPEFTLRTLLGNRVRELVFMDRLTRDAARPAAEAASECLRISRDCTAERC